MSENKDFSKMNIYQKMQYVKLAIGERELKKSGQNKFSGFSYYELGDFLPSIIDLCTKVGLFTQINFSVEHDEITTYSDENEIKSTETYHVPEVARLTIINSDNPTERLDYDSAVKKLELKGTNEVQSYGGVQTYLRRYLYMNAFDIVEADMFDIDSFEDKKTKKKEKADLDKLIDEEKEAFKAADEETKKELGSTLKTLGYSTFKDLSEKQNKDDIISLAKVLNVEVPEKLLKEEVEKE